MKIEQTKIESLIPYARNSRTHSDAQIAQIAASIKEFGFTNPVLIDGDGGIIAGHGRVLAARKLGMQEVPTIELAHLSDTQKRAYIIADNKLALNSGWDDEMLKVEIDGLIADGFDIDLTGFTLDEIDALDIENEQVDGNTDEDYVPDVQPTPVSKPGDIWVMGGHRLMCGDSTVLDNVVALMNGQQADVIFTDPPYGMKFGGGRAQVQPLKVRS